VGAPQPVVTVGKNPAAGRSWKLGCVSKFKRVSKFERVSRFKRVSKTRFVSGHDFSRAANAAKSMRALAPEGETTCSELLFQQVPSAVKAD
jgi:hypothetical protein